MKISMSLKMISNTLVFSDKVKSWHYAKFKYNKWLHESLTAIIVVEFTDRIPPNVSTSMEKNVYQ